MREREREIEKKGTGEIPYTNLCCVFLLYFMLLSLSGPLFFVLSMFLLCVYFLSFSVSAFFFFPPSSLLFFSLSFTHACLSLFIERFQKKPFLALLSTNQIMEQFLSVFFSTTPNFMFSRDPLFSLFLFSLFRYFLNSFFLVRDSPLSPNRVPHFLVMISLYSLFNFSIILLLHLLLPVAIFNSLSFFFFFFFFIYLGTMADLLFGSPPSFIFSLFSHR